jgi:hypothetical protein
MDFFKAMGIAPPFDPLESEREARKERIKKRKEKAGVK